MATQPEVIRQQMVDTRAALTQKLNALEQHVGDKVHNAKAAVQGVFDLPQHVERHPWATLGGAAAVGFCLGQLLEIRRSPSLSAMAQASPPLGNGHANGHAPALVPAMAPAKPSWLSRMAQEFESEIERLKRLAIGTGIAMVRDSVTRSVSPEVGAELSGVMDSITVKLGGEPVHGPVL